jgi:hypothetical protein
MILARYASHTISLYRLSGTLVPTFGFVARCSITKSNIVTPFSRCAFHSTLLRGLSGTTVPPSRFGEPGSYLGVVLGLEIAGRKPRKPRPFVIDRAPDDDAVDCGEAGKRDGDAKRAGPPTEPFGLLGLISDRGRARFRLARFCADCLPNLDQ